jgi:uncharacterized protein YndB with AHSA1/START domain
MPSGGASVVVAAPRQIVWDLIADPARHTDFGTYVSEVTVVTPGPIGLGTVYTETSGPRGLRSRSEWRITTFEPPQRLVHEGREPAMRSVFTWTLEAVGADSTRLSQHGVYVMFPAFARSGGCSRPSLRGEC